MIKRHHNFKTQVIIKITNNYNNNNIFTCICHEYITNIKEMIILIIENINNKFYFDKINNNQLLNNQNVLSYQIIH